MRRKIRTELWKDALKSLRMSEPYNNDVEKDDLINYWRAEGILGGHDTYKEAYNRGITMIESLKDSCLLEEHKMDSEKLHYMDFVKMHDVVRDVSK
ncbi:hypothetical protein FXO38_29003 [Capsicum annuum]|uniref:Disease resistance protein winged helix domain-containing protein n=1 Tax=Capsicum annuum TaxID=4072 RepID=A0A2G2Y484_CAPAN|nr:hypothetical protein FXO38_29003 [Capsicum annuum]PHT64538.1 hypothetical protein T459_31606 [Capsicum annuum]